MRKRLPLLIPLWVFATLGAGCTTSGPDRLDDYDRYRAAPAPLPWDGSLRLPSLCRTPRAAAGFLLDIGPAVPYVNVMLMT